MLLAQEARVSGVASELRRKAESRKKEKREKESGYEKWLSNVVVHSAELTDKRRM